MLLGSAPAALASAPTLSPAPCPTSDAAWASESAVLTTEGQSAYSASFGSTGLPLFVQFVGGQLVCAQGTEATGFEEVYADVAAEQAGAAGPYPLSAADGFGDGLTVGDVVTEVDTASSGLTFPAEWAVADSAIATEEAAGFLATITAAPALELGVAAFVAGYSIGTAIDHWFGIDEPAAIASENYPTELGSQIIPEHACLRAGVSRDVIPDFGETKAWCDSQGDAWIYTTRPYQAIVDYAATTTLQPDLVLGGVKPSGGSGSAPNAGYCGYSYGEAPPDVADPDMINLQFNDIAELPAAGGYGGTNCTGLSVYLLPFKVTERGSSEPGDATATLPAVGTGTESTGTAISNFQAAQQSPGSGPFGQWVTHVVAPGDVPAPSPTTPETGELLIPLPTPNELGSDYVTTLDTIGFTDVTLHTIAETEIDTLVGPAAVTNVTPQAGTYALPGAAITVDINPDDAPNPGAGGGGAFTPPALPGVVLPSVATPCNVFPFGIPCWLVGQMGALTASPVTPDFTVNLPWSQSLVVNLGDVFGVDLGSVMGYVRPILLFASFLGIMVWLAGFALGGSTGGGGGAAESEE